jgi:hypothetical protein
MDKDLRGRKSIFRNDIPIVADGSPDPRQRYIGCFPGEDLWHVTVIAIKRAI